MDRKQAGILVSLLVLIVIVGVASWKLNGDLPPLDNPVGGLGVEHNDDVTNDFASERIQRDTNTTMAIKQYQEIIDDKTISDEKRDEALSKQMILIDVTNKEQSLERALQAQGYNKVYCLVAEDFNSVKVFLRTEAELTQEQLDEIRAVVVNTTDIREVEIARQ